MELKDVKLILKRIQSYYPSFIIDDFKTKEWYNELKKFDYDDVNKKLEEHMRSADYGTYEPKLFYLTKYLKTKEEKRAFLDGLSLTELEDFERYYKNHRNAQRLAEESAPAM